MPTERERSCTEKEIQAIRFNHNEQRCLEKKINCLKHEGACSIKLINQTHKNIKVSYNSLKDKVSKIKTHLNVKEIDDYRRQEDEGKIELFKSIIKPDSSQRISSYAKRLHIGYDDMKSASSAKHSDDLVSLNPFCEEDMTRKEILLRQISELNERFNAVAERERAMERGHVAFKETEQRETKHTTEHVLDQNEIDQVAVHENKSLCKATRKHKTVLRPSTAFEFTNKHSVDHDIRPATSIGKYKLVDQESDSPPETDGRKQKSKSKVASTSKYVRNQVKSTPTQHISNTTFQSVMVTEAPLSPNEVKDVSSDSEKCFSKIQQPTEKSTPATKQKGKVLRSISFTQKKYVNDKPKEDKAKIKRSNTEKTIRPRTAFDASVENKSNTKKRSSKVRPASSFGSNDPCTPRGTSKGLSALSERGSEAIKNIIACMKGPQKAPFDCHAEAERAERESKSKINILEEGRTKFLSRDCIEGNLGHDLHRELRKELLQEEESNAMKIEDKICSFMDKLNAKIKVEKSDEEDWISNDRMLTMDDLVKRQLDNPQTKRVNRRRQKKFTEEEQKKIELNKYRRSSAAWKDVNKCRYLRIEESKIDLSGIKTLASDQLALLNGMRYDYEATV